MLSKPTCLHVPALYEEGTARVVWESVEGAEGYELDLHFDEDFELGMTGRTWSDIASGGGWSSLEGSGLTWRAFEELAPEGLRWRNILAYNPTWERVGRSGLSWGELRGLPARFIAYRGEGVKVPGPEQGRSWANLRSLAKTWSEADSSGWTWENLLFALSFGLSWSQIRGKEKDWSDVTAASFNWRTFERLAAMGLSWGSLNGRFLSWAEVEAIVQSWRQFENAAPDSRTHIAHDMAVPLYKTSAILRVRAYGGEVSGYTTTSLFDVLPRSLAPYEVPCLHVPALYREGEAELVWGELYGAASYVIERRLSGEADFTVVYSGSGTETPNPEGCERVSELHYTPDCKRHFAWTETVPTRVTTAQYRIKGVNSTDESKYLATEVITLLPRSLAKYTPPCLHVPPLAEGTPARLVWGELYDASGYVIERKLSDREFEPVYNGMGEPAPQPEVCAEAEAHFAWTDMIPDNETKAKYRVRAYNTTDSSRAMETAELPIAAAFEWDAEKNKAFRLVVRGDAITTFDGVVMRLEYAPDALSLMSFTAQSEAAHTAPGVIPEERLAILSSESGRLRFSCSRVVPSGEEWSGAVTVLEFMAAKTGSTKLRLYKEG